MEDDDQDAETQDTVSRLRIVGTGSRRTRLPELYLAVDHDRGRLTDPNLSWLGAVEGTPRTVAVIRHPCLWHEAAGGLSLRLSQETRRTKSIHWHCIRTGRPGL